MRRFDFNDDEFEDVYDDGYGDEENNEEYLKILEKREVIRVLKIQLYQKEINLDILDKTLNYLSRSFFWRFYKYETKLKKIIDTYQTFKYLIDIDNQNSEEEEKEK